MAVVEITEGATLVFINIFFLVGQISGFYCFQKLERRRAKAVIDSNLSLTSAVSEMVKSMKQNMQQNAINFAVAKARSEDEIIID